MSRYHIRVKYLMMSEQNLRQRARITDRNLITQPLK
jgi:hypothetical protein